MKFKNLLLISCCILFSCKKARLDALLYANDNTIKSYKLDAFEDTLDYKLSDAYNIQPSFINELTLQSKTSDEITATAIKAFYIGDTNKISTDTVILYSHGNAGHMDWYWQRVKLLANTGSKNRFGVLFYDYRGFGLSQGKPSEKGLYADAQACLLWLKSKGLSSDRLIVYGFSLGSAPTTEITSNNIYALSPSKIILEAPFAGSEVMANDGGGSSINIQYLSNNKIDNARKMKVVKVPLCWFHGIADDFLSIKTHGEIVYKNHTSSYKQAFRVTNAKHSNVPGIMGVKTYSNNILQFITK